MVHRLTESAQKEVNAMKKEAEMPQNIHLPDDVE
jgi:hypothetical protein